MKKTAIFFLLLLLSTSFYYCKQEESVIITKVNLNSVVATGPTTATFKATVEDLSSAEHGEYGICYSINNQLPTTNDTKIMFSNFQKGVTVENMITGLSGGTTYFVRFYVMEGKQAIYSSVQTVTTQAYPQTIATSIAATSVLYSSATLNASVNPQNLETTVSFEYGTTTAYGQTIDASTKTVNGTILSNVTAKLSSLTSNVTYHFRVKTTNIGGTTTGVDLTFTPLLPTAITTAASNLNYTTATLNGKVNANNNETTIAFEYGTSTAYGQTIVTTPSSVNTTTETTITANLSSLTAGTNYHFRPKATTGDKSVFGDDFSFATTAYSLPTVSTTAISNITQTTATSGGNVTADGGQTITERGICYSTSTNPTTANSKIVSSGTTGSFVSNFTNLAANTTYYFVAYAINSVGTAYGSVLNFTTTSYSLPTISTTAISNITQTTATSGGEVTSDGGQTITERGICISKTTNPTTAGTKIVATGTTGIFTSNMTNLLVNTTYFVRAYAINSLGTSYGAEMSFIAKDPPITDYDGNIYTTVTIGTQVWLVENLKTTHYRNGDPIPNVTENAAWSALTTGAMTWYNNDKATNNVTYGALYNWYAVNDARNICPPGFHVPTQDEMNTLSNFLGGDAVAGGKLKESGTTHWLSPNTAADNSSGFRGLPAGYRYSNGAFSGVGGYGGWWSSTAKDASNAWYRDLNYSYASWYRFNSGKLYGFSVRVLRD